MSKTKKTPIDSATTKFLECVDNLLHAGKIDEKDASELIDKAYTYANESFRDGARNGFAQK